MGFVVSGLDMEGRGRSRGRVSCCLETLCPIGRQDWMMSAHTGWVGTGLTAANGTAPQGGGGANRAPETAGGLMGNVTSEAGR